MFTLIVMTRANGYSTGQFGKYEDAEEKAVAVTLADKETTAVIYNHAGKLIWRWFGKVDAPAPVATDSPITYRVTTGPTFTRVTTMQNLKGAILAAVAMKQRSGQDYDVFQCIHDEQMQMFSTGYRVCVNNGGDYYAADGTLMHADGTRSIFDDVDA